MADAVAEKKIAISLEAKIERYLSNLVTAQQATKESVDGIAGGFNRIGGGISSVIGLTGTLTGILAGGTAFKSFISTTQEVVGQVTRLSKTLGITAEQASVLRIALDHSFLTADDMTAGSMRITKALLTNEDAFHKLGVATRDSDGHFRDTFSIMMETNTALSKLKEGTDQNVAGMSIYGRSWGEARNLIKLTNEKMEEAKQRAEDLHLVFGPEGQRQVKDYKLAMKDLGDVSESLKVTIGRELIPVLTQLGIKFGDVGIAAAGFFARVMRQGAADISTSKLWAGRMMSYIPQDRELGNWKEYQARQQAEDQMYQWQLEKKSEKYGGLTAPTNRALTSSGKGGAQVDPDLLKKGGATEDPALQRENQYIETYNRLQDERRKGAIDGNAVLSETDKKLAEIGLKYENLIRLYPEHSAELTRNMALDKEQTKNLADASEQRRTQHEMEMDELENGIMKSEAWLNEMGKLSDAQQARFDDSAMLAQWAARREQLDREAEKAGAAFLNLGEDRNAALERLDQERDAAIQSWAMMTDSFEENERRMTLIKDKYAKERTKIEQSGQNMQLQAAVNYTSAAMNLTNALFTFSHGKSRALFEINKVAGIANATMSTYEAADKAMASVPYPWNLAAAASVIAAGLANVASISSTSFGGGAAAGGYGEGTPTSPVVTQPASAQQSTGTQVQIVVNGAIGEKKWFEDNLPEILKDFASRNVSAGVVYA